MAKPPKPARPFAEALAAGGLVLDGAMGTALYERGVLYTACFEALCESQADLVAQVHRAYLEAGAQALTTNTFGANAYRLGHHGLARRVDELNRAAVCIAREVATDRAYVIGSVGPTGVLLKASVQGEAATIEAAFADQCRALCAAEVDAILLETFRQPKEIELALRAAKTVVPPSIPIIASVSFDVFGTMSDGMAPSR